MLRTHPDYRIICLDCLTYTGNLETLASVMTNPNFRFVKESISDRKAVYDLFEAEHPDLVINFAAESHVDRSIENPSIFLETNVMGTQVLLDACRKYGNIRYHQVSTDEVYGDLPLDRAGLVLHRKFPHPHLQPLFRLQGRRRPAHPGVPPYLRPARDHQPVQQQLRPLPLPRETHPPHDRQCPERQALACVRRRHQRAGWLYVEDHCRAIDLIVHNGNIGEVYNVGGHNEMRNIDIVKLICKALDKPESLIVHVADRKGHDMRYAIDPTKIHNELGWLPETKFSDGISKTIEWYLANRPWWEHILSGDYQNYYQKMYGKRLQDATQE